MDDLGVVFHAMRHSSQRGLGYGVSRSETYHARGTMTGIGTCRCTMGKTWRVKCDSIGFRGAFSRLCGRTTSNCSMSR